MKRILSALICPFLIACGAVGSLEPEEPVSGDLSVGDSSLELSFEAEVNETQYRAVSFANNTGSGIEINSLAFAGNDCGAFSVFSVTDESGNILYQSGDAVNVGIAPGGRVNLNLRFSPTPCEVTEYTTTFVISHTDGTTNSMTTVLLHAQVNDATVTVVCEDAVERAYYDGIGDPTPSRMLPAGTTYYLMVERMRAYIQPTGGFTSMAAHVGTDIGVAQMAEENLFRPVYLPFTSDDAGALALEEIGECDGFAIPSPVTDTYFWGAKTVLTTSGAIAGTVERNDTESIGELNFSGFSARLFANIANGASLIQDDEGNFAVNIIADLTTGDSTANAYLADVADETDDDGEPLLNIVSDGANSVLRGLSLYHGTARFVGVGVFEGTDAKLSGEAQSALLDNEAYIFIQIDARVVTEKTE